MTTEDPDRYRAPALDKGLDILELLAGLDGGLTQAEIAKLLGRTPNEFYRMLDRLVRRGYVTRIHGDRYALTLKLFGLAQLHAPVRRLVSYATPLMRELAETTRQANQLVVFDRGAAVVIAQQEAPGYWGISIRVGSHISLFDTGSGHVLLAFRSDEERRMMIDEQAGPDGPPERLPDFFARLDQIRERGYEMMASLQTAGVYNLSAPVRRPRRPRPRRAHHPLHHAGQRARRARHHPHHRDPDRGLRPPLPARRRRRRPGADPSILTRCTVSNHCYRKLSRNPRLSASTTAPAASRSAIPALIRSAAAAWNAMYPSCRGRTQAPSSVARVPR